MANRYTYDDFQKAMQSSGLGGQFSDADLKLAQQNPDAGMSILKYKQDYKNAATDEARALANLGAEGIRSSYGGYTGGQRGANFYLDPLSPKDFQSSAAPTYKNNYADTISGLLDKQLGYGSYSYGEAQPEYNNRYDATIQDLLGQIVNRKDFSYDPENDQLYSQYRKQYTREGQRATQDALGAAAAASGGIPSSYAVNAAAQAGDYYASQMTDKIPELYKLAYNKYMNDYNMKLSDLGAVQGAEQSDYDKFLNEMQQYNTNRAFDYQAWMDEYNRINNDLQTASGLEQLDYTKYLNNLNQFNTDRSFNYGQLLDEVNNQTERGDEQSTGGGGAGRQFVPERYGHQHRQQPGGLRAALSAGAAGRAVRRLLRTAGAGHQSGRGGTEQVQHHGGGQVLFWREPKQWRRRKHNAAGDRDDRAERAGHCSTEGGLRNEHRR